MAALHKAARGGAHNEMNPRPVAGGVDASGSIDWLGLYLLEDLGAADITSEPLLSGRDGAAQMVVRAGCVVAGLRHAIEVFRRLGAAAHVPKGTGDGEQDLRDGMRGGVRDGVRLDPGTIVLEVRGPATAILSGERSALNIVARMSGIATAAADLQDKLRKAGSGARVAATRKTTPGFRAFEKEAVMLGGGEAHRAGLFDQAMLKDNHLEAWSGKPLGRTPAPLVGGAVGRVVAANPGRTVSCEVESLGHALAAVEAGAQWLLIDNQDARTGAEWAAQVRARFPHVKVEASGGITPDNVTSYGWADRVSLGWLTQKVAAVDVGLDWVPMPQTKSPGPGQAN